MQMSWCSNPSSSESALLLENGVDALQTPLQKIRRILFIKFTPQKRVSWSKEN